MTELRNTYVNCQNPPENKPLPWHPPELTDPFRPDIVYFGPVLAEMDRQLNMSGLTFYFTESLDWLPSYGLDVVVVLLGDEFTRVPGYFGDVRAIFKNYTVQPALTNNVLREPSWINLWSFAWYLRTCAYHVPASKRYRERRREGRWAAPIWRIPVGVVDQLELPVKPFFERRHDIFFGGSVEHHGDERIKERINPKVMARRQMVEQAQRLAERHPELSVELVTTVGFQHSMDADPVAYSHSLMDSRLALVPRGTAIDTFRFWQALRYGCVAIVDTVPRHPWFYEGAPVVRLSRWSQLEDVVTRVLSDRERLERLHRASLEWWRTRGSPEAVGAYMADRLNSLVV